MALIVKNLKAKTLLHTTERTFTKKSVLSDLLSLKVTLVTTRISSFHKRKSRLETQEADEYFSEYYKYAPKNKRKRDQRVLRSGTPCFRTKKKEEFITLFSRLLFQLIATASVRLLVAVVKHDSSILLMLWLFLCIVFFTKSACMRTSDFFLIYSCLLCNTMVIKNTHVILRRNRRSL